MSGIRISGYYFSRVWANRKKGGAPKLHEQNTLFWILCCCALSLQRFFIYIYCWGFCEISGVWDWESALNLGVFRILGVVLI